MNPNWQLVDRVPTPINMVQVVGKLAATYLAVFGKMPPVNVLTIASGIVGLENAGGAAINNGNVGNVTPPSDYVGRVWSANGLYFIDFDIIEHGALYWWALMYRRYHPVLVDAALGEVETAVRDLFRLGYVGSKATAAELANYTKGVQIYAAEARSSAEVIVPKSFAARVAVGTGAVSLLGAWAYLAHGRRAA